VFFSGRSRHTSGSGDWSSDVCSSDLPRGGLIEVSTAHEERDGIDWATLVIRDNGIGIPSDELARVFEPYYRGTNVSASISGTGRSEERRVGAECRATWSHRR